MRQKYGPANRQPCLESCGEGRVKVADTHAHTHAHTEAMLFSAGNETREMAGVSVGVGQRGFQPTAQTWQRGPCLKPSSTRDENLPSFASRTSLSRAGVTGAGSPTAISTGRLLCTQRGHEAPSQLTPGSATRLSTQGPSDEATQPRPHPPF